MEFYLSSSHPCAVCTLEMIYAMLFWYSLTHIERYIYEFSTLVHPELLSKINAKEECINAITNYTIAENEALQLAFLIKHLI